MAKVSTGMIIDGVFASQAIDSSGEILDVEGCDISTLDRDGVANYEHKEGDKKGIGNNGEEIVGRIIFCKKVFGASDCDTDRERMYWAEVKVPFVYGMVRLYDGAGHSGAQALAAQIRDHHANNENILVRFSIEGSTLERDGMHLKASVARRVALTLKPCNRTAISGLIEDPRAPDGFDKKPKDVEKKVEDLLDSLVEKGEPRLQHPGFMKLGGVHEFEGMPFVDDEVVSKIRLVAKARMLKALAAGSYNVAPSNLVGGAALQRESLKGRVRRAIDDYKPKKVFDKAEWRAFAKTYLPEADDRFLDHFADVAEDFHAKRKTLTKGEDDQHQVVETVKPKKVKASPAPKTQGLKPPPAEARPPAKPTLSMPAPAEDDDEDDQVDASTPLTIRGAPASLSNVKEPVFDEESGVLHTPRGSFPMYIPSRDPQPGAKEAFHHIMHDEKVNKFHDYAMENWAKVHKLLKEGRLPPEVVMHATLFSQLSPNTPVPMQELMYGHLIDSMRHTGVDARSPQFGAAVRSDWMGRDRADKEPVHSPEHWDRTKGQIRLKNDSYVKVAAGGGKLMNAVDASGNKILKRKKGDLASFMLANNKFVNMAQYHKLHNQLVDLVNRHGVDARSAVNELMGHKHQAGLWDANRDRALASGKPDPGPYTAGPVVNGLAPKTARYTMGMLGGGNVQVPDTHFVRYLYGLDKGKDKASIKYLKNLLWNENNSHLLEGSDRYYLKHHDAVQHMLSNPKWKGVFDKPEDSIFPSFWKNWVAIVPHERARGLTTGGVNEYTDHRPFWEAIDPFVKSEDDAEIGLAARTAMVHHRWAQDYGPMQAMAMYYAHLVPKLLAPHHAREAATLVHKIEAYAIDLKKSIADAKAPPNTQDQQQPPVEFAGHSVIPGSAVTARGKYALLHEDGDYFYGVPEEKLGGWSHEHLVKLPKAKQNSHYWVAARPAALVAEKEE